MNTSDLAIDVSHLVTHYGERKILDDVNVQARQGEIMVIMGGSGSGKSTLLRHLLGLHRPTSGSIKLLGKDITKLSADEMYDLRKNMGVAFQGGALFNSMTVGENVALPLRERPDCFTDLLSRRSVDFVNRMAGQDQPFLLSLHYTAPHWPWETREDAGVAPEVKDNLFHLDGGNIGTYHRMIGHMDEGIGWIVDALRANGQLDNTLIVFTSDNGGERFSDNWPLVGGKMDLTEGGIRVPWIAHWPAVIPPGSVTGQHCLTMDWSATLVAAGGARAADGYPFDGVSLLPVLRNPDATFSRPMYWRMNHRGQRAFRDGRWKYLRVDGNDYLFDISRDARERANKAKREPQRLDAMRSAWEAWNDTMPPIPADATISLGYSYKDMPQR